MINSSLQVRPEQKGSGEVVTALQLLPSFSMLNKPFDSEPNNPLIRDLRIFLDPGFLVAFLLGLLLLACVGGVILYANIKYGISPF